VRFRSRPTVVVYCFDIFAVGCGEKRQHNMAEKYDNNEEYYNSQRPNENRGSGFSIMNPDGTILGRTPEGWGKCT